MLLLICLLLESHCNQNMMMERKILKPRSLGISVPSSPGMNSCTGTDISEDYCFSEPTSPTRSLKADQPGICVSGNDLTSKAVHFAWEDKTNRAKKDDTSFEFFVSSRYSQADADLVSAEELFVNGRIRPLNQQTKSLRSDGRNQWPPRPCRSSRATVPKNNHYKGRSSLRSLLREEQGNDKTTTSEDRYFRIHDGIKDSKSQISKRWSLMDFLYKSSCEGIKGMMWGFSMSPSKQAQKHSVSKKNNNGPGQGKINSSVVRYDEREISAKSVQAVNGSAKSSKRVGNIHYNKGHTKQEVESRRKKLFPYRSGLLGSLGFTTNSIYRRLAALTGLPSQGVRRGLELHERHGLNEGIAQNCCCR